ncbi:hypothetical protein [Patulibacter minatonensis]|uniref:hypothetical protein n=1 Tax=Patulibacter minatonensis TaxID=298163 RepID=UPI0012F82367|nr:hypothetical protein [Patulibacter minatonensis]
MTSATTAPRRFPRAPSTIRVPVPAAAALAVAGPCVATARGASYSATGAMVATELLTSRGAGHPKPCSAWVAADGTVRARVSTRTGFTYQRIARVGAIGGTTGNGGARMDVSRKIDYRIHAVGATPDCTPCGPLSEFGPCGPAIPDVVGRKACAPAAGRGVLTATLVRGALVVAGVAPSEVVLRNCSAGTPDGVPLGSPQPTLERTRFRGAARRIGRLAPGAQARFARKVSRGAGCRSTRGTWRSCTTYEAVVVVTRID